MSATSKKTFKLATLNVHHWSDAKCRDNVKRVQALVEKINPDILCVQESFFEEEEEFWKGSIFAEKQTLGGSNKGVSGKHSGCTIFSKFPIQRTELEKSSGCRSVTATISLKDENDVVHVTCIHFDHRLEPSRLREEEGLHVQLTRLFTENKPQIWTGDFNALTREDYGDEEWAEIASIREKNSWESPQTDLTTKVKSRGFVDCWEKIGRPKPVKTCRFDTRIDYVFATPSLLERHKLVSVKHIDDAASDHNMVVAKFEL